jgi:hypothetical protein
MSSTIASAISYDIPKPAGVDAPDPADVDTAADVGAGAPAA